MEFLDVADGSGLDEFVGDTPTLAGVSLVAHLGDAFFALVVFLGELEGFPDGPSEWFFGVDVFVFLEGTHGGAVVAVIGDCDEYGVEFPDVLVEHFSPVGVAFCSAPTFFAECSAPASFVDLGEGHAVLFHVADGAGVSAGPATGSDERDVELGVG